MLRLTPTDRFPAAASTLDVRELLTIDVAAELRKLCQAQVEGVWQLPAELVRRAIRAGARSVRVAFSRHQVVVADDGSGIDPTLVQWTAILVDRNRPNPERHRALTMLERAGEPSLVALAGLDRLHQLAIDTTFESRRCRLSFRPGAPPAVAVSHAAASGTVITVRVAGFDRRRAGRWLADVARFAPVTVLVDGEPVADGLAGSLIQAPLALPLRGRVALVAEGDTAHAHLLAHGLVAAHLTVPEAPPFEAAVELGVHADQVDGGPHDSARESLSPAWLREAIGPQLPALIDQAVGLLVPMATRIDLVPEAHRARLARLALLAVRGNFRSGEVGALPLFRTVGPHGPALVDLAALRQSAAADPGGPPTILALSPDERQAHHAIGMQTVLLADHAERSLLAEVLGVRFRAPSRRDSARSPAATARRWVGQLRQVAGGWLDRLRHPMRRQLLADHRLTPGEQALVSALRDYLPAHPGANGGHVAMCEGEGRLRRSRGEPRVLILPRGNPTVIACVRAFHADPRWMRLISLALLGAPASDPGRPRHGRTL